MNKNSVILLIIICFFLQKLVSQEYIFDTYNTEHGLPSSEIYHVFQDSKGYIWFATDNGVSRYNGYEFENFDINDGLAENVISQIYEDRFGKIWFIGITGKLSYWSGGVIIEYSYNNKLAQIVLENLTALKMGFFIDSLQNIYISLKSRDLFKISKNGDIEYFFEATISRNLQTIYELEDGQNILAIKSRNNIYDKQPFDLLIYKKKNLKSSYTYPILTKIFLLMYSHISLMILPFGLAQELYCIILKTKMLRIKKHSLTILFG